ncbi:MAG: peptidoglycan DD-metalloendopeptidase family protein [Deltaproteobacteria bacterium]|nr:peptidoglycan DD-metalloendopeptidase family protein [Candidatus Zymogenaceae bacterium]
MKKIAICVLTAAALFVLSACVTSTTTGGVYHTVKKGQTLWRISKTYGVDMQTIAEYNDIYDKNLIYAGQEIFIPGADKSLEVDIYKGDDNGTGDIVTHKGMFIWPTEGVVYSLFGVRWGQMHSGLDISANAGTPVLAGRDGTVEWAGRKGGYGNLVVLRHSDGYETYYGHLSVISVKVGDKVAKGKKIGLVGSTGKSTGPHLHFEVRKDNKVRNPLFFLP